MDLVNHSLHGTAPLHGITVYPVHWPAVEFPVQEFLGLLGSQPGGEQV